MNNYRLNTKDKQVIKLEENIFEYADDIKKFMKKERTHWEWLNNIEFFTKIIELFDKLDEKIENLNKMNQYSRNDKELSKIAKEIQGLLNELYQDNRWPLSYSPKGIQIAKINAKKKETIAIIVLAKHLNKEVEFLQSCMGNIKVTNADMKTITEIINNYVSAEIENILDDKGIIGEEAEKETLKKIRVNFIEEKKRLVSDFEKEKQATIKVCKDEFEKVFTQSLEEQKNLFKEEKDKINKDLNDKKQELEELQEKYDIDINSFVTSAKEQIDDLKNLYRSTLNLREPVSYWQEKYDFHKGRIFWLSLTSIALAIGFFAFILLIDYVNLKSNPFKIGKIALASTGIIWIGRITIRLLLSQIHLATESKERVVMVKTYLALTNDTDGKVDKDDMKFLLSALMRPSTTGIIKDDSAPPYPLDFIKKF